MRGLALGEVPGICRPRVRGGAGGGGGVGSMMILFLDRSDHVLDQLYLDMKIINQLIKMGC